LIVDQILTSVWMLGEEVVEAGGVLELQDVLVETRSRLFANLLVRRK
jgi:hypothetical protein